jgi:site-specific DNA recombinase
MNPPDESAVNPSAPELARRTVSLAATVPVSGPSGLSDYAVSPLGAPLALMRDEVRAAFLGRTSTDDQQDPRQSILRQLGNSRAAIPESWVIVAHFYDVESGRLELNARGRRTDYDRYDIPISRDGGITELLDEAGHPGRRFDVVICESVSRAARRAFEGLSIERALERAGVPLFAANGPITLTGSRAQRILQRRINQSVAEYEVLNTLEQSWGGLCTHVRGDMTPSPNGLTLTPPNIRRRSRREKLAPVAPGVRPRCTRFCGTRNTPDTRCLTGARLARDTARSTTR